MGKSTFIRAALAAAGGQPMLIDLDPGQKMIGPPGTATLGQLEPALQRRFVFIGSTSSSSISAIARAAAELAVCASREGPFIANTSGFVKGLGKRLQAAIVAALKPDLIVEIGPEADVPPLIPPSVGVPLIRVTKSMAAQRKSAAARARLRQAAFREALNGVELHPLRGNVAVEPGPPVPFAGAARPVCALANDRGVDVAYGILKAAEEDGLRVLTAGPVIGASRLRLGRMWAGTQDGVWRLLERLEPAWTTEPAA